MIFLDWVGESGDPYWGSVIFLLHADDADGTTLPVDSSSFGQTLSVATFGLATTTAVKKFGAGSLTSTIPVSRSGRLVFLPGTEADAQEYCIEFWIRPSAIDTYNFGIGFANQNGYIVLAGPADPSYTGQIMLTNAGVPTIGSVDLLPINDWTHVAVARAYYDSTPSYMTRLFINGVKKSEATNGLPPLTSTLVRIGEANPAGFSALRGFVDDIRITAGVPRYTADFTPPTKAFPDGF